MKRHPLLVVALLVVALLSLFSCCLVFVVKPVMAAPVAAVPAEGRPQIINDPVHNVVRVVIGGKEVLTIDRTGLHVNGDVTYSGILTSDRSKAGQGR